ncbi:MAG TPA: DUF4203 domain-containing protein [Methylomirabilota bacterium]|jgi:hypothetical protein
MASWWVTLLVGLAVLLLGRRLFWLFVGAAGFFVGLHLAPTVFGGPEWLLMVAALVLGIVGAVLAIVFQWLAIGLAGFAAGVEGALAAAAALGLDGSWLWAVTFVAGIVVAALALWLWDPVLILLSALVGAGLLAPLIPVSTAARPWIFLGLAIVGIVFQASVLAPPEGAPPRRGRRG